MTITDYLDTFAGRRDCYAAWIAGDWRSRTALDDYRHHPRVLTARKAAELYRSGTALALYCLADGGRSQIAAVDFDDERGLEMARGFAAWLITFGALPYLEPSRDGRAHVWTILDERLDVTTLRRGLSAALMRVPAIVRAMNDHPDPLMFRAFELRPMTVPRAFGNAVRAPLFPHPRTGVVYPLLGPRGDRYDTIAELRVERTAAAVWERLARQYPWRVDADSYFRPDWPTIEVAA